jgi:hypothetical protein
MRIINQRTKAEFDKIAAISFKMDGCHIKGTIEVQGNEIPESGVYSVVELNRVLICIKTAISSEQEWLEFHLVEQTQGE